MPPIFQLFKMNIMQTQTAFNMEFFHALSEALQGVGIELETEGFTDFPKVRSAHSDRGEGFYFRKSTRGNWMPDEVEAIRSIFPFIYCGEAVEITSMTDFDIDIDEDRTWNAGIVMHEIEPSIAQWIINERDAEYTQSTYFDLCQRN
jgi:hypothetical protein